MSNMATLRRISPDQLDEFLTRVRDEEHSDLVVLGPDIYLDPSPEDWPEPLKGQSVVHLTGYVDDLEQRLRELDKLRFLLLWSLGLGDAGAKAARARPASCAASTNPASRCQP